MNKNYRLERNVRPPRFALRFLAWFCPPQLYEAIEGDLLEQFDLDVNKFDQKKAKRKFLWRVVRFFRPGIILRNKFSISIQGLYILIDLLKNYLLISWRNLIKNRTNSIINIAGLSVSMSVGLVILMVIKHQAEFDTFHRDSKKLFRITTNVTDKSNKETHVASTPVALSNFLNESYPFIEEVFSIQPSHYATARSENQELVIKGAFTDASFFSVFAFDLISGDKSSALKNPFCVLLSEETAIKFFGTKHPIGQLITVEGIGELQVAGVVAKPAKPSHLEFEAYISASTLLSSHISTELVNNWNSLSSYTYVKIKNEDDVELLHRSLTQTSKYASENLIPDNETKKLEFIAQPFDDVFLSDLQFEIGRKISRVTLIFLSSLAAVILLLAIFSYTNLTIARAFQRSKEIGIRRVNGALRSQLFLQFTIEAIVVSMVSLLFAVVLARNIPLNQAFRNNIPETIDLSLIIYFLAFAIFAGCMAGFFPALALSKMKPLNGLRNSHNMPSHNKFFWKNSLIVIQFTLSLLFITVLLFFYKQREFQIASDYGFTIKNIVHLETGHSKYQAMMNHLTSMSAIDIVSASSHPVFSGSNSCKIRNGSDSLMIDYYAVDQNYIPAYDLILEAGRNFPIGLSSDHEQKIILNELALDQLKLGPAPNAIGKFVQINDSVSLEVAGVLKNFHNQNFKHSISPIAFRYKPDEFKIITLKANGLPDENLEKSILGFWKKIEPDFPLKYSIFKDEFYQQLSHADDFRMLSSLVSIAIVIACLGLLGVVMNSTQSRIKEIGIRKVMGATVIQILNLLSWNYFRLLLMSGLIALPLGSLIGEKMAQQFVYKTPLTFELFATGFGLIAFLGILTVASQTIAAALRNPVDTLRYE